MEGSKARCRPAILDTKQLGGVGGSGGDGKGANSKWPIQVNEQNLNSKAKAETMAGDIVQWQSTACPT